MMCDPGDPDPQWDLKMATGVVVHQSPEDWLAELKNSGPERQLKLAREALHAQHVATRCTIHHHGVEELLEAYADGRSLHGT